MTATLADLLVYCAGATVPCSHLNDDGKPWPEKLPDNGEYRCYMCVDQPTPGRIFFFPDTMRLPCQCRVENPYFSCPSCLRNPGVQHSSPNICDRCSGRLWVPTPDPYAWHNAVEAKGWRMTIFIGKRYGAKGIEIGSYCSPSIWIDGSDQLSEMTAVERMLRQKLGADYGTRITRSSHSEKRPGHLGRGSMPAVCRRCGYIWQPRVPRPKRCPYCLRSPILDRREID